MNRYVIITPVYNEEDYIRGTIESVLAQTARPLAWVMVNDGSTDSTRKIVESYLPDNEFMRLVNLDTRGARGFGRKAEAFRRGLLAINGLDYDFIGNLDGDIALQPDYYECVLREFEADPKLGLAGGIIYTKIGDEYLTSDETLSSVGGAVQLFRRECFDGVGGYLPLKLGGIDAAAEIKTRMLGWKVRKFPELKVYEMRRTGSVGMSPMKACFREGRRFYSLGYGPVFFFVRCIYRLKDPPLVLGSIASIIGYLEGLLGRRPVMVPNEMVAYLRFEQRQRLRRLPKILLGRGKDF